MTAKWDVLGFGAVAVDDLLYLDAYPAAGSKAQVREERREGGGLAGTALVAAARLGARAAYAGVLGDDELSRFTLAELKRAGVDCSAVLRRPDARPRHSVILVDRANGCRTVLSSRTGVIPPPAEMASVDLLGACRVLFVDHTVAAFALTAVPLAQRLGIPVVADLERVTPEVLALVELVDHLVVGVGFARQVTGQGAPEEMVRALLIPGRMACVVTAGEQGCWYADRQTGSEVHYQPAHRVEIVDTTGCGDVFHGTYAAMIAAGSRSRGRWLWQPWPRASRRRSPAAGVGYRIGMLLSGICESDRGSEGGQQQRNLHLLRRQSAVVPIESLLEAVLFIPPDCLAGIRQDDQVADAG